MVISFTQLGNYGRLGNQIFQYAAVKSISIQKKYEFKLPPTQMSIKSLNVRCGILNKKLNKIYKEKHFHYDHSVFMVSDDTDFSGYFQSWKYFDSIKDILEDEFSVDLFRYEKAKRKIEACLYSNDKNIGVVSVHVRRGDYMKLPEHHPFCGIKYYNKAMSEFRALGRYMFYICSDDIGWCKDNIKGNDVVYSENDALTDLAIMNLSDHNIIANSSLSWWGAWLNKNPNKIVLYPSVWFGPKCPQDWYDLIPSGWEKTKV